MGHIETVISRIILFQNSCTRMALPVTVLNEKECIDRDNRKIRLNDRMLISNFFLLYSDRYNFINYLTYDKM